MVSNKVNDCAGRRSCGIEDPTGVLCRSYYICHPKPDFLEEHNCLECGEVCKVQRIEPYTGKEAPTGHWLSEMDEEGDEGNIGVLCQECASKLFAQNIISLGSSGKYFRNECLIFDAILNKKDWVPKHPEFLLHTDDELEETE